MPTEQEVFERVHAHVAKWEGGLTDDPDDSGGITNHGVCLRFLSQVGDETLHQAGLRQPVSRQTIIRLSKAQAKTIMHAEFWVRPGAGTMPPLIGVCFYDFAVNAGPYRSVKVMQQALGVDVDGLIGPETRGALEACAQLSTAMRMLDLRESWYRRIAVGKNAKFGRGWLNRTSSCRVLVQALAEEWGLA